MESQVNNTQKEQHKSNQVDVVTEKAFIVCKESNERRNQNYQKTNYKTNNNFRQIVCKFCEGKHERKKCPAFCKQCSNCGRFNHFSVACYGSKIREIRETEIEPPEENIFLHQISHTMDERKRWHEPIRSSNCLIKFKLDTGTDVNVLTLRYLKFIKM